MKRYESFPNKHKWNIFTNNTSKFRLSNLTNFYEFIDDKFQSLFEKVVLENLKSSSPNEPSSWN